MVADVDSGKAPTPALRQSLCLLTWNEIDGCKEDVPRLPLADFDEVYAIDWGSTDGTIEYLESLGIVVHRQTARGYNQAYLQAFRECTTDSLVLYHPKGTISPDALKQFRPLFAQGFDLVIASRIIKDARNEEDAGWWRPRKWFVIWLGISVALLWRREGYRVRDVLHGFRGMRRECFNAIDALENGPSIDLEMVVRAYRKRFRITEFPVEERPRSVGKSHFKAFPTGATLAKYVWFELGRKR